MKAKATYSVKKWEEKTYDQISPEMKMTKAAVEYAFTGEISGTALVEYLMFYDHTDPKEPHKSSASYIGLMRFSGNVSGKEGGFVMQDIGTFRNGVASSVLTVAMNSGTGGLIGIRGKGSYHATHDTLQFELEYEL